MQPPPSSALPGDAPTTARTSVDRDAPTPVARTGRLGAAAIIAASDVDAVDRYAVQAEVDRHPRLAPAVILGVIVVPLAGNALGLARAPGRV